MSAIGERPDLSRLHGFCPWRASPWGHQRSQGDERFAQRLGGSARFFRAIVNISKLLGGDWMPWIFNFPIHIGLLSSSQLTNSIIFQRGGPTTNQVAMDPPKVIFSPSDFFFRIFSLDLNMFFFSQNVGICDLNHIEPYWTSQTTPHLKTYAAIPASASRDGLRIHLSVTIECPWIFPGLCMISDITWMVNWTIQGGAPVR